MSEDPLTFAMDRGSIWKQGLTLLRESGLDFVVTDVNDLAEFLAGDNIPSTTFVDMNRSEEGSDDDDEDESTDGRPEGVE